MVFFQNFWHTYDAKKNRQLDDAVSRGNERAFLGVLQNITLLKQQNDARGWNGQNENFWLGLVGKGYLKRD